MKECNECETLLPLTDFYKHGQMSGGRVNKCKECTKKGVRKNRSEKVDYYREYDKKRANLPVRVKAREDYAKTDSGIESANKAKNKWAAKNSIKVGASTLVGNAVRDGKLEKTNCIVCDSDHRICGHHEDYNFPMEVIWLCNLHHRKRHKEIDKEVDLKDSYLLTYI